MLLQTLKIPMICMSVVVLMPMCNVRQEKQISQVEVVHLDSLETLFAAVPVWLSTVYDTTSGGFYHNALMVNDSRFEPDIQSTTFALSILINGNVVEMDTVNQKFKDRLSEYVYSRYDSTNGFFLDPLYADRILKSDRALGRSQGMAGSILDKIGIKTAKVDAFLPLQDKVPEYLRSLDQFKIWLHQRNWDRVWTAFDHIAMQSSLLKRLPPERADSIVRYIRGYVESIQNEDGLWGKGQAQEIRFSGAAKYGTFCMNMKIPMPHPDKIYQTVMEWFHENEKLDFTEYSNCAICVPRNALRLLYYIEPSLNLEIPQEDRKALIQRTSEMLKYYSNEDGGFMKNNKEAKIAPLDINYGEYDTLVSDINGTHLAVTARKALYDVLKIPVPRLDMGYDLKAILNR